MDHPVSRLERILAVRGPISQAERDALRSSARPPVIVPAGSDIVRQGDAPGHSTLIVDGFAWRYKILPTGGRQVSALHIAGDFADLHSFMLPRLDNSVGALTDCRVVHVGHSELAAITDKFPNLTRQLWRLTVLDAAMHREWLASLGRRDAVSRLSHLISELYIRLEIVGLARDLRFTLPMSRAQLADALGMSAVHVTRSLMQLQRRNLLAVARREVIIRDWPALLRLAAFDPIYLQLPADALARLTSLLGAGD
jgi:CRP-like cAMP-binding protein